MEPQPHKAEQKPDASVPYRGDSPFIAGIKQYASNFTIWTGLFVVLDLAIDKVTNKVPFRHKTFERIKEHLPFNITVTGILSLFDFYRGYRDAEKTQHLHKIVTEVRTSQGTAPAQPEEATHSATDENAARHAKPTQTHTETVAASRVLPAEPQR